MITIFGDFCHVSAKNGVFLENLCSDHFLPKPGVAVMITIFANFRRKIWRFLKNQCYDPFLPNLALF
jgi:hypothetical protein